MLTILRKEGWKLNPSDKIVNSIFKILQKNGGICPCHHSDDGDLHCPCESYRLKDNCKLYINENT